MKYSDINHLPYYTLCYNIVLQCYYIPEVLEPELERPPARLHPVLLWFILFYYIHEVWEQDNTNRGINHLPYYFLWYYSIIQYYFIPEVFEQEL